MCNHIEVTVILYIFVIYGFHAMHYVAYKYMLTFYDFVRSQNRFVVRSLSFTSWCFIGLFVSCLRVFGECVLLRDNQPTDIWTFFSFNVLNEEKEGLSIFRCSRQAVYTPINR